MHYLYCVGPMKRKSQLGMSRSYADLLSTPEGVSQAIVTGMPLKSSLRSRSA